MGGAAGAFSTAGSEVSLRRKWESRKEDSLFPGLLLPPDRPGLLLAQESDGSAPPFGENVPLTQPGNGNVGFGHNLL